MRLWPQRRPGRRPPGVLETAAWFGLLGAVTAALVPVRTMLNEAYVVLAYLLLVQLASARGGRPLGIVLALTAFLCFDWYLLPPYNTLILQNPFNWLVLVAFLVTSVVSAHLLARAQDESENARQRAAEVDRLASLGAETLNAGRAEVGLAAVAEVIRSTLGLDECTVYGGEPPAPVGVLAQAPPRDVAQAPDAVPDLVRWVMENGQAAAERHDGTTSLGVAVTGATAPVAASPQIRGLLRPLRVRGRTVGVLRVRRADGLEFGAAQWRVLDALSYYAALGVERVRMVGDAERVLVLQEAHRAKDAVIASVSHDLRTPLTTIKGLAHELAESGDERAWHIEEEADRLNRLVADLLDLSRISSGAMVLEVEPNEAEDLVGAAARRAGGLLDGRDLRIDILGDALMFGRFDFAQTLRALVNLIENAAKYSPSGAPIDLVVRRDEKWLCFSVEDRGPGVPEPERDRIFEPFYRRSPALAPSSGAGLGLSIARSLVEAQGGSLTYHAREGGGSVFAIRVPAIDVTDSAQVRAEAAR